MTKKQSNSSKTQTAQIVSLTLREFSNALEEWLLVTEEKSCSPRTLEAYRANLGKLDWFLRSQEFECFDTLALRKFFQYLRTPQPNGRWDNPRMTVAVKTGTLKTYDRGFRAFFSWLVR